MVVIRLARWGAKSRPFYRITVSNSRRACTKKYIERIGFFNPRAIGHEEKFTLQKDRFQYWVDQGAQVSDRLAKIVKSC